MGRSPGQAELFRSTSTHCDKSLPANSIYRYLHDNCHVLFPDEMFDDLFQGIGRGSIPPRIIAVVMVLQRLGGFSDREAVDKFVYDLRWKYAAGGLPYDYEGFVHTVLVRMRAKLRESERPDRIFEVALQAAHEAGVVKHKRVLDSTPLYDAVATQDTVTMIRWAIRGVLRVADSERQEELREELERDDDYRGPGKPACEWDDKEARGQLIDELCRDGYALLAALDGKQLSEEEHQAVELLATVLGQDIEKTEDGRFQIARKVSKDRVISTVDPETRHGHKTSARGFDGYKGHIAIDPDSEIITSTAVTAANVGDAEVLEELLADVIETNSEASNQEPQRDSEKPTEPSESDAPKAGDIINEPDIHCDTTDGEPQGMDNPPCGQRIQECEHPQDSMRADNASGPRLDLDVANPSEEGPHDSTDEGSQSEQAPAVPTAESVQLEVYGDSAYGGGKVLAYLQEHEVAAYVKTQPASARKGCFSKEQFRIDLENGTVTCPNDETVTIMYCKDGLGLARFQPLCDDCPLREQCTQSKTGRAVRIDPNESLLMQARQRCSQPDWKERYRATRPKVERKIGHLMRRRHGGRRARVRGQERVARDFAMLAAAVNLQRLAKLVYTQRAKNHQATVAAAA